MQERVLAFEPISNSATNVFSLCFLLTIYFLFSVRMQMAEAKSLCSDMDNQVLVQEAPGLVSGFMFQMGTGEFSLLSEMAVALCSQHFVLKHF